MYSYENTDNYPDDCILSTSTSTAWSTHWIELLRISRKGIYDFTQFLISTEKLVLLISFFHQIIIKSESILGIFLSQQNLHSIEYTTVTTSNAFKTLSKHCHYLISQLFL